MEQEILLRIVLESPTPGVDFALQKGKGSDYDTVQNQTSNGDDLKFEFPVSIRNGRDGNLQMGGPFVQGPAGERFVYVDIGTLAGQFDSPWSRRLKVPLRGISQDTIKRLLSDSQSILETRVPGKGRDGSPSCATVKPFDGWTVGKRLAQ